MKWVVVKPRQRCLAVGRERPDPNFAPIIGAGTPSAENAGQEENVINVIEG